MVMVMRMKNIGSLIAAVRIDRKMTQADLAMQIGCTKQAVSHYEKNNRRPSYETLEAICDVLNVPMGFFLSEEERRMELNVARDRAVLPKNIIKASDLPMRRVPILGPVAAGQPIPALREYDEYIDIPDTGGRYDAALRVQGDSMSPHFKPEDLVFIRYCDDVLDGQVAAVALDDTVVLKKVYHIPSGVNLISENPAYSPMIFTEEDCANIHIIGLAAGFLRWEH